MYARANIYDSLVEKATTPSQWRSCLCSLYYLLTEPMQTTADKTLSPREDLWRRHRPMVAVLLLAALTVTVFGPAIQYDFIRLDDNPYVY